VDVSIGKRKKGGNKKSLTKKCSRKQDGQFLHTPTEIEEKKILR